MYSIYDLVEKVHDIMNVKRTPETKREVYDGIYDALADGYTDTEILKQVRLYKRNNNEIELDVMEILKGRPQYRNLLEPKKFYYHNQLRLISPPPVREIDYDSGEITFVKSEFFLEMKASFTIEDVVNYYILQIKPPIKGNTEKRLIGAFKYLIENYDIEELLFMIDVYANHILSNEVYKQVNPFDLEEYYQQALDNYNHKKTVAVESGGNKIVRRKRI